MRFGAPIKYFGMLLLAAVGSHAAAADHFAPQRAVMSVSVTVVERCTASSQGVAASDASSNNPMQPANFSVRCSSGRTSGYNASMRRNTVFESTEMASSVRYVASANPQKPNSESDAAKLRFRVDY